MQRTAIRTIPPAYDRLREAFRAGRHDQVRAEGDEVAASLAGRPATADWVPGVLLLHGAVLAAHQDLPPAADRLTRGLAQLPDTEGTPALGDTDRFELLLVEALAHLGELDRLDAIVAGLLDPGRRAATRLAGLRAHALRRSLGGDGDGAMADLAAAEELAAPRRLSVALVRADRAAILAVHGDVPEAVRIADDVLDPLSEARHGGYALLAAEQAAATACTVARAAADHGDVLSAMRMERAAERAALVGARPLTLGHLQLTRAVVQQSRGSLDEAARGAHAAAHLFGEHGATPARAAALREQGRTAAATGYGASAAPLLRHALGLFAHHGFVVEADRTRVLLRRGSCDPSARDLT